MLPVRDDTVDFLADPPAPNVPGGVRGSGSVPVGPRSGGAVLCWFLDGTRMSQLAPDNGITEPTGYDDNTLNARDRGVARTPPDTSRIASDRG